MRSRAAIGFAASGALAQSNSTKGRRIGCGARLI
jgi:hypothetical protein